MNNISAVAKAVEKLAIEATAEINNLKRTVQGLTNTNRKSQRTIKKNKSRIKKLRKAVKKLEKRLKSGKSVKVASNL